MNSAPPLPQTFAEDGFYIWLYERPASPWAWVWTALIPRERRAAAPQLLHLRRAPRAPQLRLQPAACPPACPLPCEDCVFSFPSRRGVALPHPHPHPHNHPHSSPRPASAVGVVGACLFPLAPNWAKVGVFYLSSGLLFLILGVLLVRAALALVTWIATGNTVWLLPNLSSEASPLSLMCRHALVPCLLVVRVVG